LNASAQVTAPSYLRIRVEGTMLDSRIDWEMFVRGSVGGLLLFHVFHLASPGPRPAARAALCIFTLSVLAYLFCQQADILLSIPWPLRFVLIALCTSGTVWMWIAARALFDDDFGFSPPLMVAALLMVILGLLAHVPLLSEAGGIMSTSVSRGWSQLHAVTMLALAAATLWQIVNGWTDDLVEPRRAARRVVAMGIGVYAAAALTIELALRGQAIGRLLPLLHVVGIGAVALAMGLLVARRSLDEVLGIAAPTETLVAPSQPSSTAPEVAPDATPSAVSPTIARLTRAMTDERRYRQEGLTLAGLANILGLSEGLLRQQINQELGYRNFNDFLHHYRLQEAAARLVSDDLPILSIALECGYGSIGPFNRAFKQRLGMTPSEYRGAARLPKRPATN
jgi:AraC-like DNA-binding protein